VNGIRRSWRAALVGLSLVTAACSGGGGDSGDPTQEGRVQGQRDVVFRGAGALRLGGTLAVPDAESPDAKSTVPAVLIIPDIGPIDRDGVLDPTQPDSVYRDLSNSFVGAGLATFRYDRRGIGASKLQSGKKLSYDDMVTDARDALAFLGQRVEVGSSPLAVVGHGLGGWTALALAASDPRVKAVVLVSTPGRPLVDVLADGFAATHGQASADKFRAIVAGLLSSGTLPGPEAIPAEHQTILGQGQNQLMKGLFSYNPLASAPQVKAPVLIVVGGKSTTVAPVDADRLSQALGGPHEVAVTDSGTTLREVRPDPPPIAFDPNNEATHVFGQRAVTPVPRDQGAVDRISAFLGGNLSGRGQPGS
jgi:pimeloyl-ACP methyl ester carboxylesterase